MHAKMLNHEVLYIQERHHYSLSVNLLGKGLTWLVWYNQQSLSTDFVPVTKWTLGIQRKRHDFLAHMVLRVQSENQL